MRWKILFQDLFHKKKKYATVRQTIEKKPDIPAGIVNKCEKCKSILYLKELENNCYVCPRCGYHYPLSAPQRLDMLLDEGSFIELSPHVTSLNPLEFPEYSEKLAGDQEKTGLRDAVVIGEGTINGLPLVIGVMDSRFRMGSMGSVVGEKITRAILHSMDKKYPFVLFTASGGARMQEGVLSLMQMAKTSAALKKLSDEKLLFIPVLTHPTTGGVSASFAMLGDMIFAEPGALIGFAGRRVIEQTIRQALPDDFQTSEFLLKHGQIDAILPRSELKNTLHKVLNMHRREDLDTI